MSWPPPRWSAQVSRCSLPLPPPGRSAPIGARRHTELLQLAHAFDGRRLCENTVGLYEEVGLTSWTQPGAVDQTEWVNQIRLTADGSPYYLQESLHPNYWAQLATRSGVRMAYRDGSPRGGACTIAGTWLVDGEPLMRLR